MTPKEEAKQLIDSLEGIEGCDCKYDCNCPYIAGNVAKKAAQIAVRLVIKAKTKYVPHEMGGYRTTEDGGYWLSVIDEIEKL